MPVQTNSTKWVITRKKDGVIVSSGPTNYHAWFFLKREEGYISSTAEFKRKNNGKKYEEKQRY